MKKQFKLILIALIAIFLAITFMFCGKKTQTAENKENAEKTVSLNDKKAKKKNESKDSTSALSESIKTAKDKKDENKPQEASNSLKMDANVAKIENSHSGSTSTSSTQNSGSSYTANDDANYATKEEPVDEEKDEPKHEPKPVYIDKWIPEEGHYETVVIKEAWTEEVPVYEQQERILENGTNRDLTHLSGDEEALWDAIETGTEAGGLGGWHSAYIDVQVGTETIEHEAETEKKWVVDVPGHYETVLDHYE